MYLGPGALVFALTDSLNILDIVVKFHSFVSRSLYKIGASPSVSLFSVFPTCFLKI